MGANAFAEFVASQQPAPDKPKVDWSATRDYFLRKVDDNVGVVGGDFIQCEARRKSYGGRIS